MEPWLISTGIASIVAGVLTIVLALRSGRQRAESLARVEMLRTLALRSDDVPIIDDVQTDHFDDAKWADLSRVPDEAGWDRIRKSSDEDRSLIPPAPPAPPPMPPTLPKPRAVRPNQFVVTLPDAPGEGRHHISFERR